MVSNTVMPSGTVSRCVVTHRAATIKAPSRYARGASTMRESCGYVAR